MGNNRAEVWAKEARLRDAKLLRRRKFAEKTTRGKQVAALAGRFPGAVEQRVVPPFELRRGGEWSVWTVYANTAQWCNFMDDMEMISANRYASWLNAVRPAYTHTDYVFLARVNPPVRT